MHVVLGQSQVQLLVRLMQMLLLARAERGCCCWRVVYQTASQADSACDCVAPRERTTTGGGRSSSLSCSMSSLWDSCSVA